MMRRRRHVPPPLRSRWRRFLVVGVMVITAGWLVCHSLRGGVADPLPDGKETWVMKARRFGTRAIFGHAGCTVGAVLGAAAFGFWWLRQEQD